MVHGLINVTVPVYEAGKGSNNNITKSTDLGPCSVEQQSASPCSNAISPWCLDWESCSGPRFSCLSWYQQQVPHMLRTMIPPFIQNLSYRNYPTSVLTPLGQVILFFSSFMPVTLLHYLWGFCQHVCMYTMFFPGGPRSQRCQIPRNFKFGVTGCKLPSECWDSNSSPLEKQCF